VVCTVCCVTGTCVTGTCVTSADRIDIAVRCAPQGGDSGAKERPGRREGWDFGGYFLGGLALLFAYLHVVVFVFVFVFGV